MNCSYHATMIYREIVRQSYLERWRS